MATNPSRRRAGKAIPAVYDLQAYAAWHNESIPEDAPLLENVAHFRNDMKNSQTPLREMSELLDQIAFRTEPECRLNTRGLLADEFAVPTETLTNPDTQEYDFLFKSLNSTVEKMWRKNVSVTQNQQYVSLANLQSRITDLVRTSVVAPTLYHAHSYVERLERWQDILGHESERFPHIDTIEVDREGKLASGYFAYHTQVHFTEGLIVEVQVYSELSRAWRGVSHKLYEQARLGEEMANYPGAPTTRFVSLGHMIHIVEWELDQLVQELKDQLG